jgi:hypothetical protein
MSRRAGLVEAFAAGAGHPPPGMLAVGNQPALGWHMTTRSPCSPSLALRIQPAFAPRTASGVLDHNRLRVGEVLDKRLAVRIELTLAHQIHLENPLADGVHQRDQMCPTVLAWSRKFRPQPRLDLACARVRVRASDVRRMDRHHPRGMPGERLPAMRPMTDGPARRATTPCRHPQEPRNRQVRSNGGRVSPGRSPALTQLRRPVRQWTSSMPAQGTSAIRNEQRFQQSSGMSTRSASMRSRRPAALGPLAS